jgi:hypothetical protein
MQFVFSNLPPPPFLQNVLVARKNRLHAQNYRPVSKQGTLLEKPAGESLASRQGMVVADQDQVGDANLLMDL